MLNGCYDYKNLDTKIKPFDLKLISELKPNHPVQKIMMIIRDIHPNYQTGRNDEDVSELN